MIKFKKIHEGARIPSRGTNGAAGFDLYSTSKILLEVGRRAMFGTGIQMELDEGYFALIKPRSGLAYKHGIDVLAGVIDCDYRGEIKVILQNHGQHSIVLNDGDRIAQLIVLPYLSAFTVEGGLSDTDRGDGGFGSTGV